MLWRAWCFFVGLPLGALVLLAAWTRPVAPPLWAVEAAAAGGGLALLGVVSLVARSRDDDPDRGRHLAASASVGLAALPGLGLAFLDAGPPLVVLAGACLLAVAVALARGAWRRGPAPGALGSGVGAALALVAGAVLAIGWTAVAGSLAPSAPRPTTQQANAVYDLDARVPTRLLPRCGASPARVETLLDRGAHPRLGPNGQHLWFDARAEDGRRQVHRMELATRTVTCWTCGEEGDNVRPAPSDSGAGVVFETNRWATWRDPADTEIQITAGTGDPGAGSRRLTVSPGADSHPLLGPGGGLVAWSRSAGGVVDVVAAPLRSGHGGILLGNPRVLHAGGSRWAAPLAWAPDARSLVVVRGNPLRPLDAASIDLATGARTPVGDAVPGAATASFNGDGGWLAVPTTARARVAGLLPSPLGFLVAPVEAMLVRDGPRFRGSGVRTGQPFGPGAELALGDVATWGEPTGIALEPDGRAFVLGQRRRGDRAPEERLVRVELDCTSPGGA
jgi:hypothetical protein